MVVWYISKHEVDNSQAAKDNVLEALNAATMVTYMCLGGRGGVGGKKQIPVSHKTELLEIMVHCRFRDNKYKCECKPSGRDARHTGDPLGLLA